MRTSGNSGRSVLAGNDTELQPPCFLLSRHHIVEAQLAVIKPGSRQSNTKKR